MITVKMLKKLNACQEGIKFFQNNKLEGFPISKLNEIKGDYKSYINWLKTKLSETRIYDKNDNLIHSKASNGLETYYKYDSNNNIIHYKNSNGIEYWQKYDSNNNLIHSKDCNGFKIKNIIEYYDNGQLKKFNDLEIPQF